MRKDEYRAKLGFLLFAASLTMFFITGMVGYGIVRTMSEAPPFPLREFPASLLVSTLSMFAVSGALHFATLNVRYEHQVRFRTWLRVAFGFAVVFMAVQAMGMRSLVQSHGEILAEGQFKQFGLIFFLVLLHALHVLGGLIALFLVMRNASLNLYDHEKYWGVEICAYYWHFLDVVWIIMLATFAIAR